MVYIKRKRKAHLSSSSSTEFKLWCFTNDINMKDIRRDTELSIGCIHGLWNVGKASKSTVKLLSFVYKKYKKTESQINKMITTLVSEKTINKMITTSVSEKTKAVGVKKKKK